MSVKAVATLILCIASTQAVADKAYWSGSDGDYARGRDGKCVRTILWTEDKAIAGCEGGAVKETAKVKAAPVAKKSAPAAAEKAAPVAAPVAAKAAAPAYVNRSLASGASFELGGSTLSSEGKAAVAALVEEFKGEKVESVIIEGYTDDRGDAAFNQHLSEKRAEAVRAELIANGANGDKISTVGYGESNPIADNNTRAGRAKNRRVEIKVDVKERQL